MGRWRDIIKGRKFLIGKMIREMYERHRLKELKPHVLCSISNSKTALLIVRLETEATQASRI